jgi:oxalate---CoA ligase
MTERVEERVAVTGEHDPAGSASPLGLIRAHAARDADAVALLGPGDRPVGYGTLAELIEQTVAALRAAGVRPRDRIAMILADDVDAAVLFLAAATAAVCSPLNPAYSADELDRAFTDLSPALLVLSPGVSATARTVAARRGLPVADFTRADSGYQLDLPGGTLAEHAEAPDAGGRLLLQTSGTTGRGKLVPLGWPTMLAGARASASAYGLGPADRRLNIMPLFHVQGLVGSLLAALCCGSSVVCAGSASPADVLSWLAEFDVTWFSASPTMHQRILDAAPADWAPPPTLRFVRSGSAALPPALRERLVARYRLPVVESYGMTEAHQIASTPLLPGATDMVPTGSEIGLRTDDGITTAPGVRGEIVVRGANVIDGYLAPVEANAESFVDGWFRTGDEGELTGRGTLLITGRIKDLIIRGGEKVSPAEIENVLLAHPAIRQAVAFGVPDPVLTEQVAVIIVTHDGHTVGDTELREFARAGLAPYKVPSVIERRQEIPVSDRGKVSRAALAAQVLQGLSEREDTRKPVAAPPQAGPRTPVEAALVGLWAHALRVPSVGVHDDFFALGGQSLEGVALLTMVNESLGTEIDPLTLFDEANTVARMAELIQRQRATLAPSS